MAYTLEELRAENAAAETANAQAPQPGATEVEDAAADDLNTDDDHADDQGGEDGQKPEPESWMKGDDQESQEAGKKFTDGDIGAAKAKLRAKLEKQHQSELDELRAQLEAQRNAATTIQPSARPKREDFYDQDDPDDAYAEALMEWKLDSAVAQKTAQTQQFEAKQKQLLAQQKISTDVDQHYERAAQLAAASGISPELYQSADLRVRTAIEGIFPGGGGEVVTNALIASMGEGSEKVFYSLGVSQKRLAELTSRLQQDPSGIQAALYLGGLNTELTAPARKKSNTPAPATTVQGDMQTTDLGKSLHRKYLEAHKRGDTQAAFDVRREAKEKKVNINSW